MHLYNTSATAPAVPVSYAFNLALRGDFGYLAGNTVVWTAPASTVLLCEEKGVPAVVTSEATGPTSSPFSNTQDLSPLTNGRNITFPAEDWNGNNIDSMLETGNMGNPPNTSVNGTGAVAPTHPGYDPANPTGWHNGGSNFIMADGHAKWLTSAAVSPGDPASALGSAQNANNAASTDVLGQYHFGATFSPM